MFDLDKNEFINKPRRLANYDYGSNGMYFVTINTSLGVPYFGDVLNGEMYLNNCGMIAKKLWLEIPIRYPYITLDEFVVMPNHTHGILMIQNKKNTLFKSTEGGGVTGLHNPMFKRDYFKCYKMV